MHFAKASAASTVVDGWKTVETCQAYLILAAYGFPTRRFEEDRGWCYTAIATRMAVELNLNKPPPPNSMPAKPEDERHEREMLNNRRTWMLCCIMDYSTAMQLGKPPTILEDEVRSNILIEFIVLYICIVWCLGANGSMPLCLVDPQRGALVLVEHVPASLRRAFAGDHQLLEDYERVHRGCFEYPVAFAGAFLCPCLL